jgi:hypothetical protein
VIKTSGYPITFVDAVIRNLVRIVDFLPSFYGLGLITMFISRQARRLGDYAAGTIVVKERMPFDLPQIESPDRVATRAVQDVRRGQVDPEELSWDLVALSGQELQIVQEFLSRAYSLNGSARERIAADLATRVADRIGARPPLDSTRFLERVSQLRASDDR